jgi:hypothetical protein
MTPRTLVFSGHRLDAPGRAIPRFPAEAEARARAAIRAAVEAEIACSPAPLQGIAGAASGGDILFHEVCGELRIPTEIHLAKPPAEYVAASVADGGPAWVERFERLAAGRPVHVLEADEASALTVWEQSNLEILDAAAEASGPEGVVLLALWNGEGGDGPGGTAGMVEQVERRGGHAVVLDAKRILLGR